MASGKQDEGPHSRQACGPGGGVSRFGIHGRCGRAMEETTREKSYRSHALLSVEPHGHQGTRRKKHRVAWFWLHYLHSKIWRSTPGRADIFSPPLPPYHVAGGHV